MKTKARKYWVEKLLPEMREFRTVAKDDGSGDPGMVRELIEPMRDMLDELEAELDEDEYDE